MDMTLVAWTWMSALKSNHRAGELNYREQLRDGCVYTVPGREMDLGSLPRNTVGVVKQPCKGSHVGQLMWKINTEN